LAGLRGVNEEPLPLRSQLFPVHRKYDQWMTPDADEKVRICTGQNGRLTDTLGALLERRLWLAEKLEMRDKPLDSPAGATLEDVNAFLRDDAMDERIAALLPGLSLCDIPRDIEHGAGEGNVPAAFALLKLSLTPDRILHSLGLLPENDHLPVPAGMLAQLAAGNHGNRAVQAAWRRLRVSGLAPVLALNALPREDSISPLRASAALLIPLRYRAIGALARGVLSEAVTSSEPEAA
jgi:CRISPR-associated protein Csx17